jgi:glycine cleavage system aminomethyltransferase T
MTRHATIDMVADAAARLLDQGEDLKLRTVHYTAQYLLRYEKGFTDCDYTQLASAVLFWRRGIAP